MKYLKKYNEEFGIIATVLSVLAAHGILRFLKMAKYAFKISKGDLSDIEDIIKSSTKIVKKESDDFLEIEIDFNNKHKFPIEKGKLNVHVNKSTKNMVIKKVDTFGLSNNTLDASGPISEEGYKMLSELK
jgi:hypothetical protein